MNAKSMLRRIFRINQRPQSKHKTNMKIELGTWHEMPKLPTGDAAALPMKTWDASADGMKAIIGETPEPVIHQAERDDTMDVVIMRWLPTEEEVTGWASRNLRRLSPETLAAGLRAYVQQHPVTA